MKDDPSKVVQQQQVNEMIANGCYSTNGEKNVVYIGMYQVENQNEAGEEIKESEEGPEREFEDPVRRHGMQGEPCIDPKAMLMMDMLEQNDSAVLLALM